MLEAEVEALKTLVITSTPSKPGFRRRSTEQLNSCNSCGSIHCMTLEHSENGGPNTKTKPLNQEREVEYHLYYCIQLYNLGKIIKFYTVVFSLSSIAPFAIYLSFSPFCQFAEAILYFLSFESNSALYFIMFFLLYFCTVSICFVCNSCLIPSFFLY